MSCPRCNSKDFQPALDVPYLWECDNCHFLCHEDFKNFEWQWVVSNSSELKKNVFESEEDAKEFHASNGGTLSFEPLS